MAHCENAGMECGLIDDEKGAFERREGLRKRIAYEEEQVKRAQSEDYMRRHAYVRGMRKALAIIDGEEP